MGTEVFDFDKTLTYRDTTLPLFCFQQGPLRRLGICLCYYALAVLVKLNLLQVAALKECLLNVFYPSYDEPRWQQHCAAFAPSIHTNRLYAQTDWSTGQKWVVSASMEAVLRPLFPSNVQITGSIVRKTGGRWQLQQHPYGPQKATLLQAAGLLEAQRVYTDSRSDQYLMAMADEIVWVQGDQQTPYTRAAWESARGKLPQL